jgi:hypothetical protein
MLEDEQVPPDSVDINPVTPEMCGGKNPRNAHYTKEILEEEGLVVIYMYIFLFRVQQR